VNWFWLNVPLAAAFFVAWTGVPMWLVLRQRPERVPAAQAPAAQAPAPSLQAEPAAPRPVPAPERSTELAGV
jgi:hypothetical protein